MKGKGLAAVLAVVWPMLGCGAPPMQGLPSAKVSPDVYAALTSASRVAVLVVLRESAGTAGSQSTRTDAIAEVQGSVLAELHPGEFYLTHRWANISGLAGEASLSALHKLEAHPAVEQVGLPGTKYATSAESLPLMQASEAHSLGFTGKGVAVAVLDTGIDNSHRDLFDAIVAEACFCTGACRCPNGSSSQTGPGSARDDDGHGTNVTGIINSAGRVAPVGVAPDSSIVAIKVLGPNGGGDEGILSGLDSLVGVASVKVINMSLSGGRFTNVCDSADAANALFGRALASLRAQGTVTFVASGNNAFSDAVGSPACINAAVAVGAVYDDNVGSIRWAVCPEASTRADQATCFSNSSPLVELLAPGALITSSGMGGGTSTEGGTSQATPHVAGAAAVLLQANPGLSPDEIVSVLKQTGAAITDPKNGLTLPRINLKAALDRVR